jgi:hypothetical protein
MLGWKWYIGLEKYFREFGIVWAGFGLQKQISERGLWYRLGWIWYWAGVLGRAGTPFGLGFVIFSA